MKILKSKYYKQINYLESEYINGKDRIILKKWVNDWDTSNEPFTDLLDSILPKVLPSNTDDVIIRQENIWDFEECDDFYPYTYSKSKNKVLFSEKCFFHKNYEIFIVITTNLTAEYEEEMYEEWIFRVKNIYFDNQNPEISKKFEKFFNKYLEKYISKDSKISLLVKEYQEIKLKEYKIHPKEIDFKTMYNDDFKEVNEHITKELKLKSKWIILLHWLAGTWKTNYIKWLTSEVPNKKFIFVPLSMIQDLLNPEFISFFIENKNCVFILEDCENYISERNSKNAYSNMVASILNLADGFLSDVVESQIIATFNANISDIDSALLREWRLIAEYCFKKLEIKKANSYFKKHKINYKTDKKLTLSETTNIWKKIFKEQKKKAKIWFQID